MKNRVTSLLNETLVERLTSGDFTSDNGWRVLLGD